MEHRAMNSADARKVLDKWVSTGSVVGFCLIIGDFACQAQTSGTLSTFRENEYVLEAAHSYWTIDPNKYTQIESAEDDQFLGIRFRGPHGAVNCGIDVLLFASKSGEFGLPPASSFIN